jgi:amino acid permease
MVVGIYGALIAYAMGSGEALAALTGFSPLVCGVIFFGVLSWLVYLGLGAIERSESFMLPVVLAIALIISALAIFGKNFSMANLSGFSFANLLVPYGVVLFAYLGTSAIPEMKCELKDNRKELKKAIMIGSLIPIGVYLLFAIAVVGVLGVNTREVGALGLAMILGEKMSFLGAVFALCTMTTSFLALGLALKDLFRYDYGLTKNTSWLLSCFTPLLLFLLIKSFKLASFIKILEITGVITGAIVGILVVLMALNSKKAFERKPEYSIYINKIIAALLIIIFIIGAVNLLV